MFNKGSQKAFPRCLQQAPELRCAVVAQSDHSRISALPLPGDICPVGECQTVAAAGVLSKLSASKFSCLSAS